MATLGWLSAFKSYPSCIKSDYKVQVLTEGLKRKNPAKLAGQKGFKVKHLTTEGHYVVPAHNII
jgi:hypothetical protein